MGVRWNVSKKGKEPIAVELSNNEGKVIMRGKEDDEMEQRG